MSYTLNSVIINPSSKSSPKNAVILCHGYGGDGNDISILANYWKTFLPDTLFVSPDAPENCAGSPMGYQWFPIVPHQNQNQRTRNQRTFPFGLENKIYCMPTCSKILPL